MTLVAFLVAFCLSGNLYADVKIAVIDSGSTEKVYKSISFSKIPGNIDPIGHGTKIAKLIKNGNPEAEIYMLQVCEKQGFGYRPSQESVLKAIEWCVDNDIDIVNRYYITDPLRDRGKRRHPVDTPYFSLNIYRLHQPAPILFFPCNELYTGRGRDLHRRIQSILVAYFPTIAFLFIHPPF